MSLKAARMGSLKDQLEQEENNLKVELKEVKKDKAKVAKKSK